MSISRDKFSLSYSLLNPSSTGWDLQAQQESHELCSCLGSLSQRAVRALPRALTQVAHWPLTMFLFVCINLLKSHRNKYGGKRCPRQNKELLWMVSFQNLATQCLFLLSVSGDPLSIHRKLKKTSQNTAVSLHWGSFCFWPFLYKHPTMDNAYVCVSSSNLPKEI